MKCKLLTTLFVLLCGLALGTQVAHTSDILDKYSNPNSNLTDEDLLRDSDDMCASIITSGIISPKVTDVFFQLRTKTTQERFALTELEQIVTSKNFDPEKKLVLYISGWLIGLPRNGQKTVENAYHVRNDTNFVATDSTFFLKTVFKWSSFTAKEIGQTIADGLAKLVQEKMYPLEKIHVIGHSLGVDISGYVGRYFKEITGKTIPRITGLDPADSCFNGDDDGLQVGNADFIDVIHTNVEGMGSIDALGNVDFYVGDISATQPGCRMLGCSHIRACSYYAETVHPDNANNFLGVPCPSIDDINAASCKGTHIRMGYAVPHTARGIFYLEANSKSPYGKNDTYQGDTDASGYIKPYNMILLLSVIFSVYWFIADTFSL